VLVPDEPALMTRETWSVVINYAGEGYVADHASEFPGESNREPTPEEQRSFEDAVLRQLRENRLARNDQIPAGWSKTLDVRWAMSPRYDAERDTLSWAEDLRLEGYAERVTNFKVCVLGRRGFVAMQANADMRHLPVLMDGMWRAARVDFEPGLRRQDYRPGRDPKSRYDTIGLVIGKPYEDPRLIWIGAVIMGGLALALVGLAVVFAKVFGTRKAPASSVS
jgi:uncharacterized membrane-anchored protein